MNLIKKIIVSSLVATSMFTASAFAAEGDAKTAKALDDTIQILGETISLVESGAAQDAIIKGISDAKQAQKEYRFEPTERKRQVGNTHIRDALFAQRKNDKDGTLTALKAALASYQEMKPIYDATH